MQKSRYFAVPALLLLLVSLIATGQSQETKPATKPAESTSTKKAELKGRLPNNFGKLGISEAQRKKIYEIQASYKTRIEMLEAQLEALKMEQNDEIRGVLTKTQQTELDELTEASRKKAAAKRATKKASE